MRGTAHRHRCVCRARRPDRNLINPTNPTQPDPTRPTRSTRRRGSPRSPRSLRPTSRSCGRAWTAHTGEFCRRAGAQSHARGGGVPDPARAGRRPAGRHDDDQQGDRARRRDRRRTLARRSVCGPDAHVRVAASWRRACGSRAERRRGDDLLGHVRRATAWRSIPAAGRLRGGIRRRRRARSASRRRRARGRAVRHDVAAGHLPRPRHRRARWRRRASARGPAGDVRAFDVRTGQAALAVPHRAAARRARPRHLVGRCVAAAHRRQRLDVDERRRGAGPGVPAAGLGVVRLLRRRSARAPTSTPTRWSRSTRRPASAAGISSWSITTSGTTTCRRSRFWSTSTRAGADDSRRRAAHRRWGWSSSSTASPASRCSASRSGRCPKATSQARRRGRRSRFPSSRRRCRGLPR